MQQPGVQRERLVEGLLGAGVIFREEAGKTEVGAPTVDGSTVEVKVLEHGRGDKIRVFKMKAKKRYQKTQGHRQAFTRVEVLAVK